MQISVAEAKANIEELIERAAHGEDIVLTNGEVAVQLTPVRRKAITPKEKEAVLRAVMESGRRNALPGPSAARSQDFLYDEETGLPA